MPAPSGSDEITGETRYRTGWFGKLILQVEEVYSQGYHARPQPGAPTHFTATRWRDARASDLYLIGWYERAAQAKAEGAPPPPPPEHYATLNGRVRGGYQPRSGSGAPKVTPTGGSSRGKA